MHKFAGNSAFMLAMITVTILNAHLTLELNYMYIGKKLKCPKLCAHVSYVTMEAAIYVIIMFMIAQ